MLERREITRDNIHPLLRLEVRRDQDHLVARNPVTIAQVADEQPDVYLWALPRVATSVVGSPTSSIGFCERPGFTRTGTFLDDEIVLSREA